MRKLASFFDGFQRKINIPLFCIICGKMNYDYICANCLTRIEKYKKLILIYNEEKKKYFKHCDTIYFDKLFYFFQYRGLIRKLILSYKFFNKSYLCNFFAKLLLNCKKTNEIFSFYDIIIPVPMERKKLLKRGYNQTELITDIISKNASIINGKNYIKKIRITKVQSSLNLYQRRENIKNAFCVNNNIIKGKSIILFDDICTTGNTVNEISRVLKLAGAKEVFVLVLAKD